jgi:hypothetical protein
MFRKFYKELATQAISSFMELTQANYAARLAGGIVCLSVLL